MTRVMIVARGARAAVYLNDTPVAYFEDADFDTSGGTGLFCQSLGQVVCEFDNVKLWRLESVPGLPSAGSLADQARAFAEPILKTIANRKPDFADDFSTPDKGWSIGTESQGHEGSAIQGGVARLRVYDGIASYKNTALNRKDFVLQTDARVAEGDSSTHLLVTIHVAAAEYWFNVELNSRHGSWIVRKKWGDQQTDLVTGIGNVSPLGEWTRIMILARGPQAAIYFNGTPIAYFEDADFDRRSDQTVLHCQSILQAACEFDNVKFWNLANVPGLP